MAQQKRPLLQISDLTGGNNVLVLQLDGEGDTDLLLEGGQGGQGSTRQNYRPDNSFPLGKGRIFTNLWFHIKGCALMTTDEIPISS